MEEGGGGRGGDGTNGIEFIIQFNTTRAFVQTDRIIINFQNSLRHFSVPFFLQKGRGKREERERETEKTGIYRKKETGIKIKDKKLKQTKTETETANRNERKNDRKI